MSVQERMKRIVLLDKMKEHPDFCREIGLSDASTFDGKGVNEIIAGRGGKGDAYNDFWDNDDNVFGRGGSRGVEAHVGAY